nr:MAG TPA: hypothetical protein [Caudoviricetes sp.]
MEDQERYSEEYLCSSVYVGAGIYYTYQLKLSIRLTLVYILPQNVVVA